VATYDTITCEIAGPVATITLNRPAARNAMSHQMVEELLGCFGELRDETRHGDVRVALVQSAGDVFCAGGDVRDLSTSGTPEENAAAVARLDELLRAVNEAPQVVVARVQGAALGGGLGLVCVSDVAIAGEQASFGLPEVRLGLVPSVISPYVVARVGFTRARQLMLTGARIGGAAALAYGLVHETCPQRELEARVRATVDDVLRCAPPAVRACKRLLFEVARERETLDYRVELLNRLRTSEEAQQGMLAFLSKQPAPWVPQS
jgi:enoyl-CoA hydratase/carnithine racemase